MAEKITFSNGHLNIPNFPIIPFIEGDGIGVDIWPAAKKIIDAAVKKAYNGSKKIEWKEVLAGEKAFAQTGTYLPEDTLNAFKEYLIGIKGPLTTPISGGFRSLNVALRQELDLFACVRPVRYFNGVPSPVKHPENVDMTIFRENTEDIYAGIEFEYDSPSVEKLIKFLEQELGVKKIRFPKTSSIGIKPISKEGTERLVRAAIIYALENKKPFLTIVHKGNIMKFTEGYFKKWGYELAEKEFGDKIFSMPNYYQEKEKNGKEAADKLLEQAKNDNKLIVKDVIADAFLQAILIKPQEYSVIATTNLNGDYISDALAAIVGGIGIAPGANINYNSGHSIFEATHGTAPDIAGKNMANPCSLLLSAAMMLDHLKWTEAADLITWNIEKTILNKNVTYDFYRLMENANKLSTMQFAEEIVKSIAN